MLQLIRRAAQPLFRKVPRLRSLALTGLDLAARPVLLPFRLGRPPSNHSGAAVLEGQSVSMRGGQRGRLAIDLYNAGDTTWLHQPNQPGWTRLGAHLHRSGQTRPLVDFDWLRAPLPADVPAEGRVRIDVELPPIAEPGDYLVVIDLVIEGSAWFAERGSLTLEVPCIVGSQ